VLTYTQISYTNTTSNADLCSNSTRGLTVSPAPLTAGTWTVIPGTGSGTIAGTTFTPTSAGTVTIRYTKGSCTSDVAFTIIGNPATATVGANQSLCGLVSNGLGGSSASPGTGTWTKTSGPGTVTFSPDANTPNATATVSAYGTYTFQWTVSNGVCTGSNATISVTYSQTPSIAAVGPTQNECGSPYTSTALGSSAPAVGTGTWTQTAGPGTSTFSSVNSVSSTATASLPGSYTYTWTVSNGACPSNSASLNVNYYATPTTATVGPNQNICASLTSGNLFGSTALVGTGTWTQTSGPGTTTFSNVNNPNATATASVAGTYVYTWTISNGTCTPSTASETVNYYNTPATASVSSPSQNVCGSLTSASLGGNTPPAGFGTGTWTQTSGPGTTTFSNVNDPNATATVSVIGTYGYTWTISNGNCPTTSASTSVSFYTAPTTSTVGPNQDTCSLISGSLGGNVPAVGTGTWTQTSGPGVTFFSNANAGSSTASVSVQGTYVFTWTIANGPCSSSSSVTVNFYSTPTVATAGATQNVCGSLTSGNLGGNFASIGTGTWTQLAGPGTTTFSNPNDNNATATASVAGSYTYSWTISNGTCTPSSANVNVNFITAPSGGSIPNTAYCSSIGSGNVTVVGVSNANQYSWALPAGLSGSSTTSTITVGGTIGGTYTVTVTPLDVIFGVTCAGTPITGNVTILSQPIIDSIHAGAVSCYGGSDDTIIVYARTNNGTLFYSIDGGTTYPNSTGVFPGLTGGSYNVIVQDDSLCATSYGGNPVGVSSPPDIFLSIASFGNVRCNGDSSGYVNLSASGGTGAITYLWNNGATSQNISHLESGTFTVTATDAHGCNKSISQAITEPPVLTDSISSTNVSCYGANNGTATFYVNGGAPPYTYLWSNGGSTPTITNLNGAIYSVSATDNNGCIAVGAVNIVNPLPVTLTLTTTNVSCFGASNGQITANVTGGSGTYTYSWSPNVSTGPTVTNAGPGTYIVTVSDVNNCSAVDSVTITQPLTGLSVATIVTPVGCTGGNSGAIQLLPSGGVGGYTYLWSPGAQTIQIISGLSANTYTATVTDGNGCQAVVTETLTDPTPIVSSVVGTSATCAGAGGGSATLTVSGGVPAYTYLWSNFETTQNLSNLSGGLYRVIITDANGCKHTDSVIITQPLPLTATITTTNVACNGANNGSVTINVSGGTGAYSYAWTPNVSTSSTVTNASPGTYVVTVTDANGCTLVDSAAVTQPAAAVSVAAIVTDITCNNATNGSISVQVSGGTGSYTYSWTGSPATTPTISGLSAGTYTVTVTDANGCNGTASGTITNPAAITSTTTGTDVTCAGAADGTATVATVSGGTGSYTYLWTNFAATQTISGLSGGLYRVIITDANGCQHRDSVFVSEPQPVVVTLATSNVNCAGANNGSITANVTGGTGAYSYAWTPNVSSGPTVTGATAGTYSVIVTDANGCTGTASTTVTQPQALTAVVTTTNVTCYGDSNGTINISVSGGSGSYTYTWSPNVSTTSSLSNAAPGTYVVTVADANGCSLVESIVITQPASPIIVTNIVHNVTCFNGNDGSILVLASGGPGSYTYQWASGQNTQYVTGLSMSSPFSSSTLFIVTVTDANGCSIVVIDTLRSPSAITSSIAATDVTCAGASNGSAILTVSGGRTPYAYLWSNLATTKDLTNVPGAAYTVIITDSSGCRHTDTITIHEPLPLVITLTTTNISCFGTNSGSISAAVTGGTGAYTYAWTPNVSTGPSVSNAAPGTYTLLVTDANGCTATATTTITQPASAVSLVLSVTDITCNNANNGAITTQVSGGSGSYTYAWTGSAAVTPNLSGLSAGTYTVTVTDANGCTATASGTTTNPAPITSSTTGTDVTCAGSANGTASVTTVNGGTAPYTYLWSNFAATQTISGLSGGLYRVIITDAHGCEHRDSVFVAEPLPLTATVSSTNVGCSGGNTGSITVTVTGGTGAYTYTWSPNVSSGPNVTNAATGTYYVTVTDANGCSLVDSATIVQPASNLTVSTIVTDMTCNNANNGAISTLVSGGTGSYTYSWTGSALTTPSLSGLSAGTYTVTVTDAGGCTATASGTITNPSAITSTTIGTNLTCAGTANGTASVTSVNGGTGPYTYLWSTFEATQTISGLSGGLYRVIITDAHGCEHRDSAFVTEPLPVTATLNVTQISCNNLNDGSITVVASGGTGTLTYLWTPGGQTTATISNLSAGTYSVVTKDANNCSVTSSATIVNPAPLSVANVVINPRCNGANNGTITLIVNGGTPSYGYTWSGALAGSGQSAINVAPGSYLVTVTDSHGCTAKDSANVTAPAAIYVSGILSNVSCNGSADGSAIVTVYGGVLPYSYQWYADSLNGALGPITKDWTQLSGGDYYLSVTDLNNCSASYHAVIKEADSLKVTLSKTDLTCFGSNNGTLLAAARGGTTPYHYLWNNFVTDSNQTGVAAGNYGVVVTDSNGCQQTKTINVNQPQAITVNVTSVNPACSGSTTGSISLSVNGGSGPGTYSYNWSTTPAQTTSTATNLGAGTYYVTVTDANSCSQVDSATLTAPQALVVNTAVSNPTCSDGNNGFVSLDVHQGTAPYTYSWNTTPAQTGNVASGLVAGTYVATITDAGGCQLFDTAIVVAPAPIVITLGSLSGSTCVSSADGLAVVSVTGGLPPYIYQIGSVAQSSDTFANLFPGTYTLTVKDANGCQAVTSWTISAVSNFTVNLTVDHDVILAGEPIQLTTTVTSDTTVTGYSWTPSDSLNFSGCGDPNNCPNPTAVPIFSQLYIVEVTNARGCKAIDSVHVTVSSQASAFMPSAFTPNGDGKNDEFEFDILGAKTVDVQIWNRWGEKVYSNPAQSNGVTNQPGHGWDGTFRGKEVQYDVYTYQFVVTYNDGHQQTLAGSVTLMR
jgi:gliding motility-associated-like protein